MGWIVFDTATNAYDMNGNLMKVFSNDAVPSVVHVDWSAGDNAGGWSPFWKFTDEDLQLGCYCNWRFIYLDEAYQKSYGDIVTSNAPHRSPMYVYSNVGRSTITGNHMTDLLREIAHNPTIMSFEPVHVHYKFVRSNLMDILETQVAENDGKLVSFVSGVTTITLHFKHE